MAAGETLTPSAAVAVGVAFEGGMPYWDAVGNAEAGGVDCDWPGTGAVGVPVPGVAVGSPVAFCRGAGVPVGIGSDTAGVDWLVAVGSMDAGDDAIAD